MNGINRPRALVGWLDEGNIDLRRGRPRGGREIHGWKYAKSRSTRQGPRFTPESAANCGEKGESWPCNFLSPLGRSRGWLRDFCFHLITLQPRSLRSTLLPVERVRSGIAVTAVTERNKREREGGREGCETGNRSVSRNFREITLRRAARALSLSLRREKSPLFSRGGNR